MFIEIDEGPGCQQRIRQMAIVTINNRNAFHSLDLNNSRVSKHSRNLELQGGRDLGEGNPDSPSSFSLRAQTQGDALVGLGPPCGLLCSWGGHGCSSCVRGRASSLPTARGTVSPRALPVRWRS